MASFQSDVLTKNSGRVKAARKLARRASRTELGLFLAEGPQAVREALALPGVVREVFALPATYDDLRELAGEITWQLVDEAALESLTETVQPQGIVAVCRFLDADLSSLSQARLVAVCADVRDPGNAGTVIRCADAAGAGGVVLTGSSVDPYNGKTVRATVGSLFHLPVVVESDAAATVKALKAEGFTVLAADGYGEVDLDEAADGTLLEGKTAWLFGNEAWGLPDELAALADHRVRIPIHGSAESLNLATAASVCLYASARAQRPARPDATEVERSDLVATVAHELRSPLTGVKGFVSTLLTRWDDLTDEQKKLMLETVHTDADRLSRLITELLDVARIDTGRLSLFKRPLDAADITERAVLSLRAGTRRTIDLGVDADLPKIDADPDKFIQVITNLVENSLRHGDGLVVVSLRAEDGRVRIDIDDEGEGIALEIRERVFTKFWTSGQGGSGLGMYIVNGLVTAHNGSVVIGDSPSGGARVTVFWPVFEF